MRRIAVIGCCGAGKSTLSKELHSKLGVPLCHLDQLYWKSGWVERSQEGFLSRVSQVVSKSEWIIEGNYKSTFDIRFQRADIIVWLDYSRSICIYRTLKRIVTGYGKVRFDMAKGCPECFDWEFIKYVWRFNKISRPAIVNALESHDKDFKLIRLSTSEEARSFLNQLDQQPLSEA